MKKGDIADWITDVGMAILILAFAFYIGGELFDARINELKEQTNIGKELPVGYANEKKQETLTFMKGYATNVPEEIKEKYGEVTIAELIVLMKDYKQDTGAFKVGTDYWEKLSGNFEDLADAYIVNIIYPDNTERVVWSKNGVTRKIDVIEGDEGLQFMNEGPEAKFEIKLPGKEGVIDVDFRIKDTKERIKRYGFK